ncbi:MULTISPECIES: hypothetical protein [Pseudomonas]|uniref:hypothetical protein n=1 Tax=Pseudomonas TaxID=286 RepID=UPI000760EE25|nr:hypothetical protein [Pseudomonas monteilii]
MTHPFWIAQRHGHDWRDEKILELVDWFKSKLTSNQWSQRMDAVRSNFESAKQAMLDGLLPPLYDPGDTIMWYLFQAVAYASERRDYYEPESYRISPIFVRLSMLLPSLRQVEHIEERLLTLMTKGRAEPDPGLFEILVAGAYKSRGWSTVVMVPEQPGIAKTQDLFVEGGRKRWAAECKHVRRSAYEQKEFEVGQALAKPVHQLARQHHTWVVMEVIFQVELEKVPADYLLSKARQYFADRRHVAWQDEFSVGHLQDASQNLLKRVLVTDDVYYGSSRMVELIVGQYRQDFVHSVLGDWTAAQTMPFHATAVNQASVVSWKSGSYEATMKKAKHFRTLISRATQQLPMDCPGTVHVGYEAMGHNSVDDVRHLQNLMKVGSFDPRGARLRWVYAYYFTPEHTTAQNESMAISETMAYYRVGRHRTPQPLPNHLLFVDGDGQPGNHW